MSGNTHCHRVGLQYERGRAGTSHLRFGRATVMLADLAQGGIVSFRSGSLLAVHT